MAKGLTEKQRKILEFIIDFQKENGFPPTIRELGDAFEIGSLRGVTVHLDALVRKGFMTRERTSRSIRITAPDPREADISGVTGGTVTSARTGTGKTESSVRLPLVRRSGVWQSGSGVGVTGEKLNTGVEVERYITVSEEVAGSALENGFVIRVGATGVYGEPIVPGDLLVVRPQQSAIPGELIVTLHQGDITVGRAAEALDNALLLAATGEGLASPSPEVVGRVIGMMRRY
ncbi:MAG: hypothetical protein H7Z41_00645 [Cytophagales bacterium]|nr:hypothetical protein [Armatimonadota bacterium]